jgi:TatD DNase family protein
MVDAHCHWSDDRLFAESTTQMTEVMARGVAGFLLGGVEPDEWERQTLLQRRFPGHVWRAFGLHPYFVNRTTDPLLSQAWSELRLRAPELEALGEMGLDFRTQHRARGTEVQLQAFAGQLELAREFSKPVILHVVRAHEEALNLLRGFSLRGMVHAFSGNFSVAKRYLDLGFYLSIGARLLFQDAEELRRTVIQTPLERLLIESDCPDQAPPGQKDHDSTTIFIIAQRIAELKKLSLEVVVEQTRRNLFTLIQKEIQP